MFLKGKNKFIFISAIIFIVLYIFLAARNTGTEIRFIPIWTASITEENTFNKPAKEVSADTAEEKDFLGKKPLLFILGNRFGFFSEDGTILRTENFTERISASSYAWAQYGTKSVSTDIYSPEGKKLLTVNRAGYIHLDDDRIYLFEPGGNSVCKYGTDGRLLWRFSHTAAITAFNSSAAGSVIGYSDGKFIYLDNSGNTVFTFYPGGSNYQVILGAALSEDGKKAFCICGTEPQRVILINIAGTHYKIVHHAYLKNNSYERLFSSFDPAGEFAVFESADGIGIIDCKKLKISFINGSGKILGVGSYPKENLLIVLLQNENKCTLIAAYPPDSVIGKTEFNSENSFLTQNGNKVYIGIDAKIIALEIQGVK